MRIKRGEVLGLNLTVSRREGPVEGKRYVMLKRALVMILTLLWSPGSLRNLIQDLSLENAQAQFCTLFQEVKGTSEDSLCSSQSSNHKKSRTTVTLQSWRRWAQVKQTRGRESEFSMFGTWHTS